MKRLLNPVAIVCVLLLCGCCSFNRAWNKAGRTPPPADSIEGRWEGRWLSDHNGHTGKLRCVLTRVNGNHTHTYTAYFRATYWKIFRYSYKADFPFERRDGVWHFKGSENLGWLAGGVYDYEGLVSSTNFHSTYRSKYDHGTFEMRRPDAD
ncbi:MAG TPA: hypothetical protein VFZ59_24440 [Verrucomicrobiae bacterium]|nr:hypothetical protein [Verrucomicrobiae bacterium]